MINAEKQARHLPDTVKGTRSYLNADVDPQRLLNEFAGKGTFVQSYKEYVDCRKIVGFYVDEASGLSQATSKITIHYSKMEHILYQQNRKWSGKYV